MSSDHLTSYTSSTSPRTPRRSPKTTKNLSNNKSPKKVMKSPSFTPKGWETKQSFFVYEKPKGDDKKILANVKGRNQGVWTKGYVTAQNPQELWVFYLADAPTDLSSHIHGVWGYKPGGNPEDPNDVWFYPPNFNADYIGSDAEKLPSYFTQRGVWTYPIVKRNVAEIAPEATGWLGMGETVKIEKLDVAGTWKMLYKQGAQEDDAPKGPGMKSKSPKSTKPTTPSSHRTKKKAISNMKIAVITPDGNEITMKVFPTNTVGDIQSKLETQEGIPKCHQRLISPQGVLLDDQVRTLESHNIRNGDTLRLENMRVRIKNDSGNDRANEMFIIDHLTPSVSVAELKRRVEDQEGIAVDDQLLSLNGKILDDLSILKDCGVGHEQLLCLEAMSIQVRDSFRSSENLYTLDCGLVSPSSTIEEIKMLLNDVHNLPPPEYLRLRYRDSLLDEDSNTLKNYDIPHKAILDLEPLGLTVETPKGTSISLQLHPTDTIQRVKELVEEKENVPVSEQHLLFEGTTLKDSKTLVESDIHDGDTLILGGMQVHIQHFNGHTITLDVTSTTTIDQIKEMIQDIEGTPIDQQFLSLGSKHLKDEGRTLSSYNIKHGSTLKLEKMKIFIQSPTGKFPLHVSPVTTMEELKHMIVEKTSIAPRNQVIHFRDSTIGDDNQATLSDCGIQHRDTLQVEDTGAKDDPAYMVQVSEYRDAFSYVPSPKKNKSPRAGRKVPRNKASSLGGTSFGNFFETSKMADREAGTWTHTLSHS
ncbi:ubiquitin [Nitzschia inconspicua]|uniref:Ubiquitin n=1 Tax=Nitzschia inconspicua TaxID=303405 RepID=A0A9K3KR20_9STRA|nr:ubiquitin [Nitzschia inconspicua]